MAALKGNLQNTFNNQVIFIETHNNFEIPFSLGHCLWKKTKINCSVSMPTTDSGKISIGTQV